MQIQWPTKGNGQPKNLNEMTRNEQRRLVNLALEVVKKELEEDAALDKLFYTLNGGKIN